MEATVNGTKRVLADGTTIERLLADLGLPSTGIAVAVNDRVVRRSAFAEQRVSSGDAVEIIQAVAGG